MKTTNPIKHHTLIPFHKSHVTGSEKGFVNEVIDSGLTGGNGVYTQKCQSYFEERFNFGKSLLTTSCTDALEMCALLADIKDGDEVILPAFNFVSAANAFLLRGAKLVFVPSRSDHPGMDESKIEACISNKTKVIIAMHYAGVACDMDIIMALAKKHKLLVIEEAAHAIDATYKGQYLGGIGDFATFSFHESKNVSCGEGGLLVVNNPAYREKAELLWQMGTNRAAFQRGECSSYRRKGLGSSFLPSELNAAYLWGQLQGLPTITQKRQALWNEYYKQLRAIHSVLIALPQNPSFAEINGHCFYLTLATAEIRNSLMEYLKSHGIASSPHFRDLNIDLQTQQGLLKLNPKGTGVNYADRLLRLPLYPDLSSEEQQRIVQCIKSFAAKTLRF